MSQPFSIRPEKSALLVMDFQNVVLNNYLSAGQATHVLARTAELLAVARKSPMRVIYVIVAFRPGYPEISAHNKLFSTVKAHGLFARGGADTAIHSAIMPTNDEPVVIKHRIGAFSGTDLDTLLRANHIETLVLAGVTTAGVVLSTARQAFDRDYRLVVVRDCCADPDQDIHHMLVNKVLGHHADVVSADDVITALHIHEA